MRASVLQYLSMEPEKFIGEYEAALATQDWSRVEPLIHPDACVTFSTGTVHKGKEAVRGAFEANFGAIAEEHYEISDIHWVHRDPGIAVYLFSFAWTGLIGGEAARGGGRGTCVIVKEGPRWQLLVEHLGPRS
jgi:ketosteroid isomerase-like protein